MSILNPVKKFLYGLMIRKGVVSAAKLIVSYAAAQGISLAASVNGIDIDLSNEAVMVVAINSLLSMLRNYLKHRFPKYLAWL